MFSRCVSCWVLIVGAFGDVEVVSMVFVTSHPCNARIHKSLLRVAPKRRAPAEGNGCESRRPSLAGWPASLSGVSRHSQAEFL
jgi:hypothetical protein